MEQSNERGGRIHLFVRDTFWAMLAKPFWLIAMCMMVQTGVLVYLAFYQPVPKIDAKLLIVNNALLDLEARMLAVEQEHVLLFKMLRGDSEQHGVLQEKPKEPSVFPLPPSPDRRIGESLGDKPGI